MKKIDESWTSEDGCTTLACENIGDQIAVSMHQATCPDISDCPFEDRYQNGCCQYCNMTVAPAQSRNPQEIFKTDNYIKFYSGV